LAARGVGIAAGPGCLVKGRPRVSTRAIVSIVAAPGAAGIVRTM
jgi:hypothetical protein